MISVIYIGSSTIKVAKILIPFCPDIVGALGAAISALENTKVSI